MEKIRIYEFAKKIGKESKDVVSALEGLGVKGKKAASSIDEETAKKVKSFFSKGKPDTKKAATKKAPARKSEEPAAKKSTSAAVKEKPAAKKIKTEKPLPEKARAEKPKAEKPKAEKKKPARQEARKPGAQKASGQKPRPVEQKGGQAAVPRKQKKSVIKGGLHTRRPGGPAGGKKKPRRAGLGATMGDMLPEDVNAAKVPDRFQKETEGEKLEKFKGKPGMQKAFQAIRKIDPSKRRMQQKSGGVRRKVRGGGRFNRQAQPPRPKLPSTTVPRKKEIKIQEGISVKEFAEAISYKHTDLMKKFIELGYMPNINQPVDLDAAILVAESLDIKIEVDSFDDGTVIDDSLEDEAKLQPRAPIVTIMGHVDHGKTSLLDAIREARVMESEAGGITQHIGAYKVSLKDREIVFLDTPGHEAFTALRARGASVTDIVVLIVAADDGVKPQTVEAIDHAKAAGVPIMVAINKIDKPGANLEKVRGELSEQGIVSEEWGGTNIFAEISAKQRTGIDNLLELILLQADMMELKANPDRGAAGVIIESRLDKGKGPVATVLIQKGVIRIGDVFVGGTNTGKVRAIYDDSNNKIQEAGPATPVELIGFGDVPMAGDMFAVVEDEKKARQITLARLNKKSASMQSSRRKLTLEDLFAKIKEGEIKDLNIVIKGDVQGSVEAIKDSLLDITHDEVQVKVIHAQVGGINESDVMLAAASNAIIIGFNVRPEIKASQTAESEGVDIELYNVIYEAINDVKKALEGMLEPTIKEKVLGRAEVRNLFSVSRLGTIAGCMVVDGVISRASDGIRVIRDNIVSYEGNISSLKRFKDDAKEVKSGYECGIMVENFNDIKVGDILENFVLEKIAGKL
ncbi:MAG: translation initiation factor IF-2 [Thermodesulfovibrionales bacterium]|nr:translation initiation factor IF-2 [Thermodesulfovibrionales bacterium]